MEQVKRGVPFIVKIRTYVFHALIALIAFVVDILVFQFCAENATEACAEIKRICDAPHSEIVFSGEVYGEDSFFYLKQQHIVGSAQTNVSCDIFMVTPGLTYKNNDIYFDGTLESGTCAVSLNLAQAYGLKIGDEARIAGTEKTFEVVRYIAAQSGIDKDYMRDGIAVLSYDGELLSKQYSYVSFATDGDGYRSLLSLVMIADWEAENVSSVLICAAVFTLAFAATMAVCEFFLFSPRRRDYSVLVSMGGKARKLFGAVWFENAVKYLAPVVITAAVYSSRLWCYGAMYAIPTLYAFVVGLAAITAYSLISVWRLYKCRVKIKR